MKDCLNILLAEDDLDDSFLFREAITRLPYLTNLHLANDGELLLEMLLAHVSPDIIFLDLNMPKKDGYMCLQEIRAMNKLDHVPVIVLSTSLHEQSVQRAFAGGADRYIQKPDNFADLIRVVEFCLQQKGRNPDKSSIEKFLLTI